MGGYVKVSVKGGGRGLDSGFRRNDGRGMGSRFRGSKRGRG